MRRMACALMLVAGGCGAASASQKPDAAPSAAEARSVRGVEDPRAFVTAQYDAYLRGGGEDVPDDPVFAYSDRLRGLFDAYERWAGQHEDLVGALDFDWWVNAQDWALADLRISETPVGNDRRIVAASFTNDGRPDEIRFHFVRQSGRWYLDDAVEGTGSGDGGWTLSELLQLRPE